MTTLAIETRVTGNADREDRNAMLHKIAEENTRRAALDPPGEVLPSSTVVEQRASYAIIMSMTANDVHRHNVSQSDVATLRDVQQLWPNATDQQRAAALAALQ
jgi:hypothetical protein